jgi:hypothetical protein
MNWINLVQEKDVAGSYKHGNEYPCSIKRRDCLEELLASQEVSAT